MLSTFSIALKPQTRKTKKKILNLLKKLTDFKSRTGWVSFQEPWQCHDLNLLQSMFHWKNLGCFWCWGRGEPGSFKFLIDGSEQGPGMRFSGLTLSELRVGVSLSSHPLDIYFYISYQRTSRGLAASPISTHRWFILKNFNFQTHRTGRFFASRFKKRDLNLNGSLFSY